MQAGEVFYLAVALFVIVETVLLFLDRRLFSVALPFVFAGGIYMAVFWKRRMVQWNLSENSRLLLHILYGIVLCGLGLFGMISCLTNWI